MHAHTLSLTHSHTCTHTHTHAHTRSLTHMHTLSLTLTHMYGTNFIRFTSFSLLQFPDHLSQEHQLQIVCALQNCASVQELVRCLLSYGVSPQEDKSTAYHSENELLRSRVKHLEAKLQTLTGSFENAKLESEAMFEKLSKVEANNVRLRHATRQCQQAYEIQELLCELRLVDGRVGDTTSSYAMPNFDSPSRSPDRDLSGVRHILLSRARTLLHTLESSKEELQSFQPSSQSDTGSLMLGRTLTLSVTSGFNSCGSESELASNEIDRLRSFSQALLGQSSHLIGSIEEIDGLKQLHCVKQPSVTKDTGVGSDGGRVTDMEENTNTEELCKVREEKAELKVKPITSYTQALSTVLTLNNKKYVQYTVV